jgi:hypothetical protein
MLNRLLIEVVCSGAIAKRPRLGRYEEIVTEAHYVLWCIYQAREISMYQPYRRERAIQELFNQFDGSFKKFARDDLFDRDEHRTLSRKDIWSELELACWKGIRSFSSDKAKLPRDYIETNHLAYVRRRAESGRGRGSAHLRKVDIRNWASLLLELHSSSRFDQLSPEKRIWLLLPRSVRTLISRLCSGLEIEQEHQAQIIEALNALLDRDDLFDPQHFIGVGVPQELVSGLHRGRAGLKKSEMRWLNRRILESLFPLEIARKEGPNTIRFSEIARALSKLSDQSQSMDVAQRYPNEMSVDPDMAGMTRESIHAAAVRNICLVYKGSKRENLLDVLDVVLVQAFGGETPSAPSVLEDDRITMSRTSAYNCLRDLRDVLGPLLGSLLGDDEQ